MKLHFPLMKLLNKLRINRKKIMNQRLLLEHNKMNIGKLLRLYRQHAKFKSQFVAKELAISIGTYSKMENGIIELTDGRLFLICKLYNITPPEFYLHFNY